jgi:metal-responsive CopG/Arc/MetJ family transcriptional regulator
VRGGKREGAGRPKGNPDEAYQRISITLSPAVLARIDDFAAKNKLSRSAAIEKLALAGLQKL